jgi:hypothetical protein
MVTKMNTTSLDDDSFKMNDHFENCSFKTFSTAGTRQASAIKSPSPLR